MKKHSFISSFLILTISFFSEAQPLVRPMSEIGRAGVTVSHLPGFYGQSISIKAEKPRNLTLYYTTNGNFPDQQSSVFPSAFSADTVIVLSIRISRNGKLSDSIYSGLYIVKFKSNLPVASLIIPDAYLFDPVSGIYTGGMKEDGTMFGNCWKKMEKPVYFEYFPDGNKSLISQYCGLKIFGGMTKSYPEKSLRLIARKQYGPGKFKGKVFDTKSVQSFNSLVLRMSGNDFMATRFQDVMISSIARDLDLDYMAYKPSVLFLNGKYWGIYNLREKINSDFVAENHECSPDSIQLLSGNASPMHGSNQAYNALKGFLNNADPKKPEFLKSVEARMDISNFFNYQILQIHIVNTDYRGNIRYWRCPPEQPQFKWIYYDGDLGFNPRDFNFLSKRLSEVETDWFNPEWSTLILRKLLKNEQLKARFINQYCFLLSTWLSKDTFISRINYFHDLIEPEMPRHLKRRNFSQSKASWEGHVEKLRRFARQREITSLAHLQSVFSLRSTFSLVIDANTGQDNFDLFINESHVPGLPYKGKYFSEVPLPVRVESANPLYYFKSWSDGLTDPERIVIHRDSGQLNLTALFERQKISEDFGKICIQTVCAGNSNPKPWVEIRRSEDASDNFEGFLWDVQKKKKYPVRINKSHSVIVTGDTADWRIAHPAFRGELLQIMDMPSLANSLSFYLVEKNGAIADSFHINGTASPMDYPTAYATREKDNIIVTLKEPPFEKKPDSHPFYKRPIGFFLLILAVAALSALIYFIRRRFGVKKQ